MLLNPNGIQHWGKVVVGARRMSPMLAAVQQPRQVIKEAAMAVEVAMMARVANAAGLIHPYVVCC